MRRLPGLAFSALACVLAAGCGGTTPDPGTGSESPAVETSTKDTASTEAPTTGAPTTSRSPARTTTKGTTPGVIGSPIRFDPTQQNPDLPGRREYLEGLLRAECGTSLCDVKFKLVFVDEPDSQFEDCSVKEVQYPKPPRRGMIITIFVWNPCAQNPTGSRASRTSSATSTSGG